MCSSSQCLVKHSCSHVYCFYTTQQKLMAVLDNLTKDFEGLPFPTEPIAESYKSHEELQQRYVLTYM